MAPHQYIHKTMNGKVKRPDLKVFTESVFLDIKTNTELLSMDSSFMSMFIKDSRLPGDHII